MKGLKKWHIVAALAAVTLVEALASRGVLPPVVGPALRAVVGAVLPETAGM